MEFFPTSETHLRPLLTSLKTDHERIAVWQNVVFDSKGDQVKITAAYVQEKGYRLLSRIVKDEKVKRNAKIFDLWLACHTQEAIAESVGVHKDTVSEITDDCRKKFCETESDKSAMNHTSDFNIPIYNVWKKQSKDGGI